MSDASETGTGRPHVRRVQRPRGPAPAAWFEGDVQMEPVHDGSTLPVRQARVHFNDGGRTRWHLHHGDQVLYFVAGKGMVEEHQGVLLECEPGDIVHVDGGIIHRHGARPGASTVHLAITAGETVWDGDPAFPGVEG